MSSPSPQDRARQPQGIPTGGQFAASAHAESDVSLSGAAPTTDVADPGSFSGQDWLDNVSAHMGELDHGSRFSVIGIHQAKAQVVVEQETVRDALGAEIPGVTRGAYEIHGDDGSVDRFEFDNRHVHLGKGESAAAMRAAQAADRYLAPISHTATEYTDLDTHPAVLTAIGRAKRIGHPVRLDTQGLPGWAFDPGTQGASCGDVSLGDEPSDRVTWVTGKDDEPFISVTETAFVTARRDGDVHDLDYSDWEDAKALVDQGGIQKNAADVSVGDTLTLDDGSEVTVTSVDGDHKSTSIEFDGDPDTIASYGHDEPVGMAPAPALAYSVETQTGWIAHTSLDDIGGSEVRADYVYGPGSATTYPTLEAATGEANRVVRAVNWDRDYRPSDWKA